jgi:hypothetical protein
MPLASLSLLQSSHLGLDHDPILCSHFPHGKESSIDMYNNDVGQESAQKFMNQTGTLKVDTLYFAS